VGKRQGKATREKRWHGWKVRFPRIERTFPNLFLKNYNVANNRERAKRWMARVWQVQIPCIAPYPAPHPTPTPTPLLSGKL